jgi:hypothetical protein
MTTSRIVWFLMLSGHKSIVTVRPSTVDKMVRCRKMDQKSQSLARIDAQTHDFSPVCSATSIGATTEAAVSQHGVAIAYTN